MSDNKNGSGEQSAKPRLKSEVLAINLKQLLEKKKQMGDNIDNNFKEDLEAMIRQSIEEMITDSKKTYHQYCEEESAFEERITRSVLILRETSESDLEALEKSKEMESLLKEYKRLRDNGNDFMSDFEENSRLTIDRLIRHINEYFFKSYTAEESVHLSLRRLDDILSIIKTIEDRAHDLNSSFDAIRSSTFGVDNSS